MASSAERSSKSSDPTGMMVGMVDPTHLTIVRALAWTRADKDQSYTKLDLMDEPAVEDFFSRTKVDGR